MTPSQKPPSPRDLTLPVGQQQQTNLTAPTEKMRRKTSSPSPKKEKKIFNKKKKKKTQKTNISLAEFVENLLKHQDGSRAAEDGEGLASKERINHARHGCSQQ